MSKSECHITKREFIRRSAAISSGLLFLPGSARSVFLSSEQKSIHRKIAFYQEDTPGGIMCGLCPNACVLREGELSRCRSRKVYDSKLYSLAYGNPCAVNIDPVEKKPFYHFFPGSRTYSIATAGCNLACLNCQNWTISQMSPESTRNIDMMPARVVEECRANGCPTIAYTYTEPSTFYEYVFDTATLAKEAGIRNILKSNGYINQAPLKRLCSVIDAANIDLKSFNESTYLKLSGGRLQPVLDSLKLYRDMGVWLEITNLVVPSWTDNLDEIAAMCKWLAGNGFAKTPVHFSRFHPLHKLEQLPPTPVDVLNKAARIAMEEGLKYVYTGNVPGGELSETACPSCKTSLIKRQGYRIAANVMAGGKCPKCSHEIDGVWS